MSASTELVEVAKKYKLLASLRADPTLELRPTTYILPPGYYEHLQRDAASRGMPVNTLMVILLSSAFGSGRIGGFPEAEVLASTTAGGVYSGWRLPPLLLAEIKRQADARGMTRTQLVDDVLTHYLTRKGLIES